MESPGIAACNQASATTNSNAATGGTRRSCDVLEPSFSTSGNATKRLRHSYTQSANPAPRLLLSESTELAQVRPNSATAETSSLISSNLHVPPVFPELQRRLKESFDLDSDILGAGQFGTVRRCICRETGQVFACKTIPKSRLHDQFVRDEVKMEVLLMQHRLNRLHSSANAPSSANTSAGCENIKMASARPTEDLTMRVAQSSSGAAATRAATHPAIVQLHAVFEDDAGVHLVMDLCDSGDLYDEVVRRGRIPEKESALLFRQIASALAFCHSRGVMHRDMKPENILLHKQGDASNRLTVKLADFGLAIPLSAGETTRGISGSTFYMAPEVLSGEYGHSADVWSLGVLLFTMLSGAVPFFGDDNSESTEAVLNGRLDFSSPEWATISVEAKGLIRCMLHRDPRRRPTAAKVLSHPWVLLNVFGGRIVQRTIARPLENAVNTPENKPNVDAQGLQQQHSREFLPQGTQGLVSSGQQLRQHAAAVLVP